MTAATEVRDRTAIAGVGYTAFSKDSGVSTLTLAAEAILACLDDAGLAVEDVDGLVTFSFGDSTPPQVVAPALGLDDLSYYAHQVGGGSVSHTALGEAMLACATGVADVVVCYRALNSRSEVRMGGGPVTRNAEVQYKVPYGLMTPAQEYALATRQHMDRFGTTTEQLGHIAVGQRHNASLNERAMMRTPITLEDHRSSRWIAEPLRMLDCCLESDGACAVVVTSAERARDLRQPPVLISGAAWGLGHSLFSSTARDQTTSAAAVTGPRLYEMAGVGPADVDVAELYDCFTYSVLVQLEDFGFCAKGEGGPFVESGATRLGGALPVNTHGGFLSEAYIHGMNHVCEAVLQLRGVCGERQVPGAEVALSTGQSGIIGAQTSAVILRRG